MEPRKRSKLIRRIIYVLVGVVIIAFLVTRVFPPPKEPEYQTEQVQKGDVVQTVEVTGTVEPVARYQLQFDQAGKIQNIFVKPGDKVKAGDTLAALENGSLVYQLEGQKAALRFAQANLAKVLAGPKQQEINLNRLKVDLAKVDLSSASQSQRNLLSMAEKNLDLAAVSYNQAKVNYEQAQKDLQFARNNSYLSQTQSGLNLDKSYITYNQSNHDLAYTIVSNEQGLKQSKEALIPLFNSFLQSVISSVETIDYLIGAEQSSVLGTDYQNFHQSKLENAKNLYFQIKNKQADFRYTVQNLSGNANSSALKNAYNQAKDLYNLLNRLHLETKELFLGLPFTNTYTPEVHQGFLQQLEGSNQSIQQSYNALNQSYQNLQNLQDKSGYSEQTGNYSYQLSQNNTESAEIQHQLNQLTDQKRIEDANAALNLAHLNLQQARENYNKALLDYYRQADELNAGIQRAKIGVKSAQEQLNLLVSPEREEDIAPLKAQIDQAWEQVHMAEYALSKTYLVAPTDGTITAVNADPGENSGMATPLMTLDATGLIIRALVSEADAPKIHFGDLTEITFDAFNADQKLYGRVIYVSPAETIVQGVIYYEVKVQFEPGSLNIKPGMTANLVISASKKEGVISLPIRAIQYEDDQAYVEVLVTKDDKKTVEKREVTLGLEGDQNVEVLSGVQAGEEVITFKEEQQ